VKRIVLDVEKCVGCRVCEAVCSLTHEGEVNPVKSRINVVRAIEKSIVYSIPVFCLQCEEAYCMTVCPAHAIIRNDEAILTIDDEKCIGCKLCELGCPIGAISVNPEKHVSIKCDLCAGLPEPQCVKYCYHEALQLLPSERVGVTLARSRAEKFLQIQKREIQNVYGRNNIES